MLKSRQKYIKSPLIYKYTDSHQPPAEFSLKSQLSFVDPRSCPRFIYGKHLKRNNNRTIRRGRPICDSQLILL